jgi:glycerol-3-phosphate O-acyltransferase/dihydroxyacetone phosphate acyltransferase
MIELYKSGDKRQAISLFLKEVEARMREVTMTAPTIQGLEAIYMARNLYLDDEVTGLSEEEENVIYQKFAKVYNATKDLPETQQLVESIQSYKTMLWLLNIRDEQVALFKQTWVRQIIFMMLSLVRLILSLMFVLPGYIMMFPLSSIISIYAEKERIKALKSSVVKIKGYDVLATVKTVAYISTFPIYLTVFTYIFF